MAAAISLVVIIFLTIMINRIATLMLCHTGLSKEMAKFQARSALTGSGFTTSETENVMNHPVRRRIIFALMLVGNAGLVTAVSSLVLAFALHKNQGGEQYPIYLSVVIISAGIALLLWLSRSRVVDRMVSRFIDRALRRYSDLQVRDYVAVLHLTGDYQITDLSINAEDWLANKTLQESELSAEGIIVLGIQRKGEGYIGSPTGETKILPDDALTLYGKASSFKELDERRKGRQGDKEHEKAVQQHEEDVKKEQQKDQEAQ